MTSEPLLEIVELQAFSGAVILPILEEELEAWSELLTIDYRPAANQIVDYVNRHVLTGFIAMQGGRACGYTFYFVEEGIARIGGLFAASSLCHDPRSVESSLIRAVSDVLVTLPMIRRIEGQLPLHKLVQHENTFRVAGFEVHARQFMEKQLGVQIKDAHGWDEHPLPANFDVMPWNSDDLIPASKVLHSAYVNHVDARLREQYLSDSGCLAMLRQMVYQPGSAMEQSGEYLVLRSHTQREIIGLLFCTRVRDRVGHITEICISPEYQGRGLGRAFLEQCINRLSERGFDLLTLTVTQANATASAMYGRAGFSVRSVFAAVVWSRAVAGERPLP